MQVHARISKEWRRRMLFLFFMLFGIGAWFLYDGYIHWPAEAERYVEFSRIAEEQIASGAAIDEEDVAVRLAWERFARENGLPIKMPKERTDSAIAEQRVIGGIITGGSLLFLLWIGWNHTRSVRAEGELITGASGEEVEFDSIVEMDRRKWKNKGIAYAIYESNGKRRRLTLDDHKFIGCEEIILEAERRIAARSGTVSTAPQAKDAPPTDDSSESQS